jgi:hypothetical protein
MAIDKLRRQAEAETQPTNSPSEWKWFGFYGDDLRFNTDAGVTKNILTDAQAEVLAAASTLTARDSGKTFFLNATSEFATTLPSPALGTRFTFIVSGAPSGASYTIITPASAQIIIGKQHSAAGDAGDVENTAGANTITFVDGQAVAGDRVEIISDGTNWYAVAFTSVAAGLTFTG